MINKVPDILQHGNLSKEFVDQAEWLRELAAKVEEGEVLAVFAVEILAAPMFQSNQSWRWDYFKGRGVSKLKLQGAVFQALTELAADES